VRGKESRAATSGPGTVPKSFERFSYERKSGGKKPQTRVGGFGKGRTHVSYPLF